MVETDRFPPALYFVVLIEIFIVHNKFPGRSFRCLGLLNFPPQLLEVVGTLDVILNQTVPTTQAAEWIRIAVSS